VVEFDALIQINRGYYNSFQFQMIDDITNTPVDFAGYTLSATFRERGNTPLLLTLTTPDISTPDPVSGSINVIIDEDNSKLLPSRDLTHCRPCEGITHTCIMQIHGVFDEKIYLLGTVAVDNISSTIDGETP
jgi:hypothetical protein